MSKDGITSFKVMLICKRHRTGNDDNLHDPRILLLTSAKCKIKAAGFSDSSKYLLHSKKRSKEKRKMSTGIVS